VSLRRRTLSCLVSAALCLALSGMSGEPALAARRRPRPVIVGGSRVIEYGGTARIVGKLKNGRPGQKVALKRRIVGDGRRIIRRKEINDNLRAVFRLPHRARTAIFRLVFKNRRGRKRISDPHRVEVRPHLTFRADPNHVRFKRSVSLSGTFRPALPGRQVTLRFRSEGRWRFVKRVDVSDGRFSNNFVPEIKGHHRMRAVFSGDEINYKIRRPEPISIYRSGQATWYGPGLYGNTTACGQKLRKRTLGVAHRTLPCGTPVSLLYKGRTITVRVKDRGPYGKADLDLTERTAKRLNFEGRDVIGWWANS
jgi:rare lipoprotein A